MFFFVLPDKILHQFSINEQYNHEEPNAFDPDVIDGMV